MNDEQMAKSSEAMKTCAAEFKMSPEDIAKLKSNDNSNVTQQNKVIDCYVKSTPIYISCTNFICFSNYIFIKCFTKCIFEKGGIIDASGKLNEQAAVEKLTRMTNQATAEAGVNQCKTAGGSDPCDTAFKFFDCINKLKLW